MIGWDQKWGWLDMPEHNQAERLNLLVASKYTESDTKNQLYILTSLCAIGL